MTQAPKPNEVSIRGENCFGSMTNPTVVLRISVGGQTADIQLDDLEKLIVRATTEALGMY